MSLGKRLGHERTKEIGPKNLLLKKLESQIPSYPITKEIIEIRTLKH